MQTLIIEIAPNITVKIESDDVKEIVQRAHFWNSLPNECPVCCASVTFFHKKSPRTGDEFWGLHCSGKPQHESNFGLYKDLARGMFYKGEWQDAWTGGNDDESQVGAEPQAERDRLVKLIREKHKAHPKPFDLEAAVMKRFGGRMLPQLTIAELNQVLGAY